MAKQRQHRQQRQKTATSNHPPRRPSEVHHARHEYRPQVAQTAPGAPVTSSTRKTNPRAHGGVKKTNPKKLRDPRQLKNAEIDERLRSLHKRAKFLDAKFTCCCGLLKVGLASLLGLIPVVGDFADLFLAVSFMNTVRRRFDVPAAIVSQMTTNIIIDFVVGLVPVVGDFFDILLRVNMRNYALVEEHVRKQQKAARDLEKGYLDAEEPSRPGYLPRLPNINKGAVFGAATTYAKKKMEK